MNWNQYIIEASRTAIDKQHDFNLRHFKLGLCTEIGEFLDILKRHYAYGKELDIIHIKEELGDILWYEANRFRIFGKYATKLTHFNNLEDLIDFWLHVDSTKVCMYDCVLDTCKYFNLDIEDVMDLNIRKLKVRYPDKFSSDSALNRNLELERLTLEN